jgi:hypothetical protein
MFSAFVAVTLLDLSAASAQPLQVPKQIKLSEKQIQGFIAADPDVTKVYEGANPDKPDPKRDAQAQAIVKKAGFANLDEFDLVWSNIAMIWAGIDPQTKQFTEPPERVKKEIELAKADTTMKEEDRKKYLANLATALKIAKPIQFRENIDLVLKYFDQLTPIMQD